ncbi:hypothetical protein ASE86_07530 [Sphingomonas sp. Leaf33]|uniref:hypothetical protein n=1 Tax=Sphingomonas sp. Leaf33 TaxID=1736215 RepID=UPI0006F8D8DC|nr:hypothetical protein [Sphingomonas sp. Leaf33]KQN26012.1 hypothetical protein ASE86_07530 [Sphingomonas sp. Leaf33]
MRYEEIRNPALPWGFWLHTDGVGSGRPLVDEEGRRWNTVREAFWVGRLGMPESLTMEENLERLMAHLAAISRRVVAVAESAHDLFGGEWDFERFYKVWVYSQGLTGGEPPFGTGISAEGHAALVMLASTRPSQVKAIPVGRESVATLAPSSGSDDEVAAWLDRVEAMSATLPYRFERRQVWDKPAVALVGDGLGGVVPLRRTLWMQSFSDNASRDRFHVWLAHRLDRWEAWGGMAYRRGAPVLTQHLFATLMTADDGLDDGATAGRARQLL